MQPKLYNGETLTNRIPASNFLFNTLILLTYINGPVLAYVLDWMPLAMQTEIFPQNVSTMDYNK